MEDSYKLDSFTYRYSRVYQRPMTEKAIIDDLLSYDSSLKEAYDTCQLLRFSYRECDVKASLPR